MSFETLLQLNVNDKTEKKKSGNTSLTYLSWSFAWSEFVKVYPTATYEIVKYDGKPYFGDESGAMVYTKVTANELTHEMWLPVMNGANKAMKSQSYTYMVKGWNGAPPTEKTVEAFTMFDINKAVMRCLVKNLAMFGLGLYIYAGEDLPETIIEQPETISQEMVLELVKLIAEADTTMNALLTKLNWGIKKLEEIQVASYDNVVKLLKDKIEANKGSK